jgi:CDP-diglyceride synthetase
MWCGNEIGGLHCTTFATSRCICLVVSVQFLHVCVCVFDRSSQTTRCARYAAFGLLIGVAGVFGGLVGSGKLFTTRAACTDTVRACARAVLKRAGGVKDSGMFFAGHGGVSDRFDSHYLCAPATYMVAVLWRSWWTTAYTVVK